MANFTRFQVTVTWALGKIESCGFLQFVWTILLYKTSLLVWTYIKFFINVVSINLWYLGLGAELEIKIFDRCRGGSEEVKWSKKWKGAKVNWGLSLFYEINLLTDFFTKNIISLARKAPKCSWRIQNENSMLKGAKIAKIVKSIMQRHCIKKSTE